MCRAAHPPASPMHGKRRVLQLTSLESPAHAVDGSSSLHACPSTTVSPLFSKRAMHIRIARTGPVVRMPTHVLPRGAALTGVWDEAMRKASSTAATPIPLRPNHTFPPMQVQLHSVRSSELAHEYPLAAGGQERASWAAKARPTQDERSGGNKCLWWGLPARMLERSHMAPPLVLCCHRLLRTVPWPWISTSPLGAAQVAQAPTAPHPAAGRQQATLPW
jgi:hypothetical protein